MAPGASNMALGRPNMARGRPRMARGAAGMALRAPHMDATPPPTARREAPAPPAAARSRGTPRRGTGFFPTWPASRRPHPGRRELYKKRSDLPTDVGPAPTARRAGAASGSAVGLTPCAHLYSSGCARRPERASPTPPPTPDTPNEPAEVPPGRRRQGPRSNGAVVEPLWALPRLGVDRGAVARNEERGRAGRVRGQEGRENGSTTAPGQQQAGLKCSSHALDYVSDGRPGS